MYLLTYFKAYLQTQCLCLTSWKNQKKPRPQKKIVDLHKSDSSLGVISKRLKVPRSSVQTIVRKYKQYGTTNTAQEGDAFCLLEMNVLWVTKSANHSQNNSKGPFEDAGGNRDRSIYIHSKISPTLTSPERPLSKEEATAPKPP